MQSIDHEILTYVASHPRCGRDEIRRGAGLQASETTIWRTLKRLLADGKLEVSGRGRATKYTISGSDVIRHHLQTPYNRRPVVRHNPRFLDSYVPGKTFYLPERDLELLAQAGRPMDRSLVAGTYARRVLEKLLVDLAWASSRMEGNTYDILQTERLIRFGEAAVGKDRKEALMILNHKDAIEYVVDHLDVITLSRSDLFSIHALLAEGLLIDPAMAGRLRGTPVGIAHSSYQPIEDGITIDEEFDIVLAKARAIENPFEQSFFLLVHIPYLQGFVDINKRTSRVVSNVPLLKAGLAPMSFLTMDDAAYIDGLIGIYELNNVALLREVYVESYLASADTYRVLKAEVDIPEIAAIAYRTAVREAVRQCVLSTKSFSADRVSEILKKAGVPEAHQADALAYSRQQFQSLHEGNLIRYKLKIEDLVGVDFS